MDLFENQDLLPKQVKEIVEHYDQLFANESTYKLCLEFQSKLEPLGYSFDWELDGVPFNLQKL